MAYYLIDYSATFSKEDEGFVNQQGVHELFADILFADPADLEDDNCSIGKVVSLLPK